MIASFLFSPFPGSLSHHRHRIDVARNAIRLVHTQLRAIQSIIYSTQNIIILVSSTLLVIPCSRGLLCTRRHQPSTSPDKLIFYGNLTIPKTQLIAGEWLGLSGVSGAMRGWLKYIVVSVALSSRLWVQIGRSPQSVRINMFIYLSLAVFLRYIYDPQSHRCNSQMYLSHIHISRLFID